MSVNITVSESSWEFATNFLVEGHSCGSSPKLVVSFRKHIPYIQPYEHNCGRCAQIYLESISWTFYLLTCLTILASSHGVNFLGRSGLILQESVTLYWSTIFWTLPSMTFFILLQAIIIFQTSTGILHFFHSFLITPLEHSSTLNYRF